MPLLVAPSRFARGLALILPMVAAVPVPAQASLGARDLQRLSLEELMAIDVTVTSAAKRPQRLGDTSAAMYVLTAEDLRRSGVTTLPDALRLVPGVQVARIDANKWAVTVRGLNGRFANQLLVLMDGRSIYSPIFSGVFWESEDVFIEDIERIEVIRGPGASLWGANAVNGVINIISKPASETQGGLAVAEGGNEHRRFAGRFGGALGDLGHLRIYGQRRITGTGRTADGSQGNDDWRTDRAGFRADIATSGRDGFTVQGDLYQGEIGDSISSRSLSPPFNLNAADTSDLAGGNLLGRWTRHPTDDSTLSVQTFYNHFSHLGRFLDMKLDTVDVEVEHHWQPLDRHDLVWGAGYRVIRYDIDGTPLISATPSAETQQLFSGFLQDEITLVPNELTVTAGTKLEHNDYTGLEVQPTGRVLWQPDAQQSVWAAVSRAVRTPSRAETSVNAFQVQPLPTGQAFAVRVSGDPNIKSETALTYELGYRLTPVRTLAIDLAGFYTEYDRLQVFDPTPRRSSLPVRRVTQPFVGLVQDISTNNPLSGRSLGGELAVEWEATPDLRLVGWIGALDVELESSDPTVADPGLGGRSPSFQGGLRVTAQLAPSIEAGATLRAVDEIAAIDVPAYVDLDARIAWAPTPTIEVSLTGMNLLHDARPEFAQDVGTLRTTEIERSVWASLKVRF